MQQFQKSIFHQQIFKFKPSFKVNLEKKFWKITFEK